MGIKQLMKVISDCSPEAISETTIDTYAGKTIAIDASLCMYQFLIVLLPSTPSPEAGETTVHLLGMFHYTIKLLSNGIKPIFVFDGRSTKDNLVESKGAEISDKPNSTEPSLLDMQVENCKRLLRLMGTPVVDSLCESEAQCAALVKAGKAHAIASEDMDCLAFGAPTLLRGFSLSKTPVREIRLEKVLAGLGLTMDQFIDLCILLGCDYCDTIKGIGPLRATELLKKHGSIEAIIQQLDASKYVIPEGFFYDKVREVFNNPAVVDPDTIELSWKPIDEEGLKSFLVGEKIFEEGRVVKELMKVEEGAKKAVEEGISKLQLS